MTNKYSNKKSNRKVRRGQVITTFGPGALFNLENGSFIAMGIDSWQSRNPQEVIHEERLEKRLGIKYFRLPPSSEDFSAGIPYRRFPQWLFCPKHRYLRQHSKWTESERNSFSVVSPRCPECKRNLVPMSLLVVCRKGHIDDFPWVSWVHKGEQPCSINPNLKYTNRLSGAGLASSEIVCLQCSAKRSLQKAFSEGAFDGLKCDGSSPWNREWTRGGCGMNLKTVQRGASNVYFPLIYNSITIPPYTNRLWEKIRDHRLWSALTSYEGIELSNPAELKQKTIEGISIELGVDLVLVEQCIEEMQKVEEQAEDQNDSDYRYDEYKAFYGQYDENTYNKKNFEVVPGNEGFDYSIFGIKDVFLVKSLREVRTLVGFTRLDPYERDLAEGEEQRGQSELVSLTDHPGQKASWKPAVEVRGEGVFLTLDAANVNKWAAREIVQSRLAIINANYERSCRRKDLSYNPLGAEFVMLHTFAHLLIRQLSFESGYSGASLREKIYCDTGTGVSRMHGVLVYTAAGDSDGTLGGLVRQARSDRLPGVLQSLFENSRWCSNDPLCIESTRQGFESLNMSACFACSLLPETSCENFNRFLDRALVIGLPTDPSAGFFSNVKKVLTINK